MPIEEIWPFQNDLDKLETVIELEHGFQKGCGVIQKYNGSRFVFALLDFDVFVSNLKLKFVLPNNISKFL
jgi:hypothetical protein